MTSWLVLQLADSAFPTGGFAHSAGLESLVQAGELRGGAALERFCVESIDQTTHGALPFVAAVHDDARIETLQRVDAIAHVTLWNHVAARASRAQGRSLLDAAARAFVTPEARAGEPFDLVRGALARGDLQGHLAPVFGFVTRTLGIERDDALGTFLHLSLRGVLSAAVRLGVVGPFEAQSIQHRSGPVLDRALALGRTLVIGDVAQTAPLAEIFQASHDRLYSRLFQS